MEHFTKAPNVQARKDVKWPLPLKTVYLAQMAHHTPASHEILYALKIQASQLSGLMISYAAFFPFLNFCLNSRPALTRSSMLSRSLSSFSFWMTQLEG